MERHIKKGFRVQTNNVCFLFSLKNHVIVCYSSVTNLDFSRLDTYIKSNDRGKLIKLLSRYAVSFIEGVPEMRVKTGTLEIN